ncbi:uncharacterized protein RHO25_010013 [Cercospora beticola]|uniref:Ecp2 effector protein domain-containing protein n=1 Tax=Cercospora beticola TaxID=122368 RepID=A0ABZ0P0U7_CERBT|nr:hypothetical protein RHO25_010013 [Cercospora beticola]CAK1365162.1 unnamed protein product [Cercospora beticola]
MLGSLLSSLAAGILFSLLFQSIAAHPLSANEMGACLTNNEAQHIASEFVQLFNTNSTGQSPTGTDIPMCLLTPHYVDIDGDAILCRGSRDQCHIIGPDTPLFNSRDEVLEAYKGISTGETNSIYKEFQARVVHAFASCDEIAVRYEGSAKANKGNMGVAVPDGTPIKWLGTSLLKVDLQTRMVERGESSEDRLTQFSSLGLTDLNYLLNPPK